MFKNLRLGLLLLVICGVIYPLLMTGVSQLVMPAKAEGSLVKNEDGKIIGSALIGQTFKEPKNFSGRVSSIDNNAATSGSGNYAPSNKEMLNRTKSDIKKFLKENPNVKQEDIPADLLTNSGSGLDPDITPMAANIQVPRIAKLRGISEKKVYTIIKEHTVGRQFGIFGEKRVNVLALNKELEKIK